MCSHLEYSTWFLVDMGYKAHALLLLFEFIKIIQKPSLISLSYSCPRSNHLSPIMQFVNTVIFSAVAILAATANAAECYSQPGAKTCLNYNDLLTARSVI